MTDTVPFDIPDSWEWIRLGELTYNHGQKKPDTVFSYIDIGSIDNLNQKLNSVENHLEPDNAPSRARKIVEKWDIIYSTVRPYLHNMCIIDKDFMHPPIASTGFAVMACLADYCRFFLLYYLLSPCFDNYANNRENSKGVAYPAINDERLYRALIPVPPMEEQQRIVAKIEQILPYIKEYELSESRIGQLNAAFPEQLKKSILQEAIQGKMIPQDPSDEPASVLLERIWEDKARLIKEGKIKKDKNESVIFRRDNSYYEKVGDNEPVLISDKFPFDIPDSWELCRLGDFYTTVSGLAYKKGDLQKKSDLMVTVLRGGNIGDEKYYFKPDDVTISSEFVKKELFLKKGYMITPAVSSIDHIGKIALIDRDYSNVVVGGFVLMLQPFFNDEVISKYFLYAFAAKHHRENCRNITHKSGQAFYNLSREKLLNLPIPVPPLMEMKRIVDKIEELLGVIKAL